MSIDIRVNVDGAQNAERSIEDVDDAVENLNSEQRRLSQTSSSAERSLSRVSTSASTAESNVKSAGTAASSTATNLGFELTQAAQDAKFGLAGVANQVPLIAEQFSRLQKQSGSTTGALSSLAGAFTNPATGVIAAFTLFLTFKDEIIGFFTGLEQEAKSVEEQVANLSGTLSEFTSQDESFFEGFAGRIQEEAEAFEVGGATQFEGLREAIERLENDATGLSLQQQEVISERLRNRLQDENDPLRRGFEAAGVDVEQLLDTAGVEAFREQLQGSFEDLRRLQNNPVEVLRQSEIAVAEQLQNNLSELRETQRSLNEIPGFGLTQGERLEEQAKLLRDAFRKISEAENLDLTDGAFDNLRQQLGEVSRTLQAIESFPERVQSIIDRGPGAPRGDEAPVAGPGLGESDTAIQEGEIDTLAGAQFPQETEDQVQSQMGDAVTQGFRSGVTRGINAELQPLFNEIENDFARALISAFTKAATSEAANQLIDDLLSSRDRSTARNAAGAAVGTTGAPGAAATQASTSASQSAQGSGLPKGTGRASLGASLGGGVGQGVQRGTNSRVLGALAGAGTAALIAATGGAGIPLILGAAALGGLGGAFADGGRPPVGKPSIVGERGPELFVPDEAGEIVPNENLSPPSLSPVGDGGVRQAIEDQTRRLEEVQRNMELTTDRRTKRRVVEGGVREIREKRRSTRR